MLPSLPEHQLIFYVQGTYLRECKTILLKFLVESVLNDLARYRDYKIYRESQYIFLMTQIGIYNFKAILSLRVM